MTRGSRYNITGHTATPERCPCSLATRVGGNGFDWSASAWRLGLTHSLVRGTRSDQWRKSLDGIPVLSRDCIAQFPTQRT